MLSCIFLGMPGVGKTHLKFLLLDQEPPHLRTSTNCAEAPVRIEIRTITGTRVQTIGGRWQGVVEEEMFDVVGEMILIAEPESILEVDQLEQDPPKQSEQAKPSKSVFGRLLDWVRGNKTSDQATKETGASAQTLSSSVSDACQRAMNAIMEKLIHCITKLRSRQGTSGEVSKRTDLKWRWVYVNDSGGQPEYHELLPLFVRRISTAVCVIRLPDKLDETQAVEYYREGERVGDVQQSQFTAKDTVQCLANTIQAYSTQDQPPKIIVVGTHLDKHEEKVLTAATTDPGCSGGATAASKVETLEEKDRQLREMLEPDFANQLVYYSESSSPKQLIFPLNTLNRGEREMAVAESIRQSIEKSGAREEKVPIWWYIMELLLRELARELGRGVLRREECLEVARLLNIGEEDFEAALVYFDELNIIKYRPEALHGVVFIDPQIPLNKVSEMVFHSYKLRDPSQAESTCLSEEWRHFRDRGVVTKECLEHFRRHYYQDIFSEDDLIKYLKGLLVLAPISMPELPPSSPAAPSTETTGKQVATETAGKEAPMEAASKEATTAAVGEGAPASKSSKAKERFIMPALLRTLAEAELQRHRLSSPVAATLLVRFPRGCRRAGVFCCFVVHLVRHCGWDLILDTEQQLFRNFIKMRLLTSPPLSVVLIDSNTYIEVRVNAATGIPVSEYAGLLPVIKNAILSGISAACRALTYKQTKPQLTFYCPHTLPSIEAARSSGEVDGVESKSQHTATLTPDRKYWRCDLDPDNYFGMLEDQHTIWFGLPQGMYTCSIIYVSSVCHAPGVDNLLLVCYAASQSTLKVGTGRPVKSTRSSTLGEQIASIVYLSLSFINRFHFSLSALPTPRNLTLIVWKNQQGKKQQFRLMQLICHKWKIIGNLVEIPLPLLTGWEEKYGKDPMNSINAVLSHWLEHPTEYYPVSWEGLSHLLDDAELGQVALDLNQALSNAL